MIYYCFNPAHDEALANGLPTYHPGKAARGLAADLSALPLWYAGGDACVQLGASGELRRWYARYASLLPGVSPLFGPSPLPPLTGVSPWGWDAALCADLRRRGVDEALLPGAGALSEVRRLSSRCEAVRMLDTLRRHAAADGWDAVLCGRSAWCTDIEAVRRSVEQHPQTVLKAPWSGSGRGLRRASGVWTEALAGWAQRVIGRQGGVAVEPWYDTVHNFALEFETDGRGGVRYEGLSLFETELGAYRGNRLASQERLSAFLFAGLPFGLPAYLRQLLETYLAERVARSYAGPLGIDMMVCRTARGLCVHPCVELNLRRTMGHVALNLSRRLAPDCEGWFGLDFDADSRLLAERSARRGEAGPLLHDGTHLAGGVLPLTPIDGQTHFHAYLSVRSASDQ